MTPAIDLTAVTKHFRATRAVDGVTLQVPQGSVLGIVGESGCGKSTLARIILGLLPPTAGTVEVEGQSLHALDRRTRARLIQPVFQDPYASLNPRQTIRDIVALPLKAQGQRSTHAQVDEILARVGLPGPMADRRPAELSGGQRQRVAIARALILRPRIVVCDEPTSALDVSVQAQILNLLAELRRDLGLTLVFISHNLAVVEHIATDVAVMYLGRVIEHAPVDDLFATPGTPTPRPSSPASSPPYPASASPTAASPTSPRIPPTSRRAADCTPAAPSRSRNAPRHPPTAATPGAAWSNASWPPTSAFPAAPPAPSPSTAAPAFPEP